MLKALKGIVFATLGLSAATAAQADGPVVVELFTSQGCSSCPPADAMLHDLAKRSDVIALALHVDYWDYIGWKDSFADPAYTQRQHGYARAANSRTVYTPQMVIAGTDHVIGTKPMKVMDAIRAHANATTGVEVEVRRSGNRVEVVATADRNLPGQYDIQLVTFDPEESVRILRGENAGRTLSYANIVTDWDVIGRWNGRGRATASATVPAGVPVAAIVQAANHGRIVGAAQSR